MKIIRSEKEMIDHCNELKFRTSFIPTMGSLHDGHIKLLAEGKKYSNYLISSLFINPLQFNNPKDLVNYPKNYEEDISIFDQIGYYFADFLPKSIENKIFSTVNLSVPSYLLTKNEAPFPVNLICLECLIN